MTAPGWSGSTSPAPRDGITLEVCLSSNLQTGAVDSLDEHPLRRFLDAGIPVTLATDNPTVSATTLTQEYLLAIEHFELTQEEADHLIENGQKASFLHRGPQADGGEGRPAPGAAPSAAPADS